MGKLSADIPPEITEYKEKFALGMSLRQLISAGACVAVIAMIYVFKIATYIPRDIRGYVVLIICAPIVAIGFFTYNGMTFEVIALHFIRFHFFGKQKRTMEYRPPEMDLHEEIRDLYLQVDIEEWEKEKQELKALMKTKEYKAKVRAEKTAERKKEKALIKSTKKGNLAKQKINRKSGTKEKVVTDTRRAAKKIKKSSEKYRNEITIFSSTNSIFDVEQVTKIIYDFICKDTVFVNKVKTTGKRKSIAVYAAESVDKFIKTLDKKEREIFLKYYSDKNFKKQLICVLAHNAWVDRKSITKT
ncbi:MAG: PrgI family protein [Oscillospiraceae bacterium]|nr:PrgI family protein [Oscillospiraceae bacterium]